MIIVKKKRESSRGYGRGMDNTYTGATYSILKNGKEIGIIMSSRRRMYEPADWEVYKYDSKRIPRPVKHFTSIITKAPFKKAKEWAIKNL